MVVKRRERVKNLKNLNSKQTSNIIITKKAGNNSNELKTEIGQILYLLYQHNKITQKLCNNKLVIIETKTHFDFFKDVDKNLKP